MAKKPIIGVVMYPYTDKDNDKIYEVLTPIIESISKAGGVPIGIFPTQIANFQEEQLKNIPNLTSKEKEDIVRQINMCDGIIKPGAIKLFDFDRFIYNYVFNNNNIPYLGICAGMQIMAAYGKGFIKNEKIEESLVNHKSKDDAYAHEIVLFNGKLKDIIGEDVIRVSSRHSYKVPNSGVHNISALSYDNVIEAIESPYCDFNIGLQWHPELMCDDVNSKKIFRSFVDASEYNVYKKKYYKK